MIIGSANINERSQRGDRDSEIAAVIRDTDMIDGLAPRIYLHKSKLTLYSAMAGQPFKVGRFAHTLRVRLMREHAGVDVDAVDEDDLMANDPVKAPHEQEEWDPDAEQQRGQEGGVTREGRRIQRAPGVNLASTAANGMKTRMYPVMNVLGQPSSCLHGLVVAGASEATRRSVQKTLKSAHIDSAVSDGRAGDASLADERTTFSRDGEQVSGFASSMVPTLEEKVVMEHLPSAHNADSAPLVDKLEQNGGTTQDSPEEPRTEEGDKFGAPADASSSPATDDQPPHSRSGVNDANSEEQAAPEARSHLRRHLASKLGNNTWTLPVPRPHVDTNGFEDPICDAFWKETWLASAAHNVRDHVAVFLFADELLSRPKFTAKYSMLSQTILSQPGNNTRSFHSIMND